MQIATWNVNSLRARLPHVLRWWDAVQPDVLCLQETKVPDEHFPRQVFQDRGLHCAVYGQKSYNGVAILSKFPLQDVQIGFAVPPAPTAEGAQLAAQARVLAATVRGTRIYNLYCPNGQGLASAKFALKAQFYQLLQQELQRLNPQYPCMLCGDFNIAPAALDVHNPGRWEGGIMCSPPERAWLQQLMGWGLQDALRVLSPTGQVYSWWDYRNGDFAQDDGLRIDLHLLTPPLVARLTHVDFYREERAEPQPSDHIPIVAGFQDFA